MQRWAEAMGRRVAAEREAEAKAFEAGVRPSPPANEPELIVVGMDGGRVQCRPEAGGRASAGGGGAARGGGGKRRSTGRRGREAGEARPGRGQGLLAGGQGLHGHHLPARGREGPGAGRAGAAEAGDDARGDDGRQPTRSRCWRGWRRSGGGCGRRRQVIVMGDFAGWVDTAASVRFARYPRVGDWDHATEHLWEAARAARGPHDPQSPGGGGPGEGAGGAAVGRQGVWRWPGGCGPGGGGAGAGAGVGRPRAPAAGAGRAGRLLPANNAPHMDYPEYRRRGWPIGSGNTEAGVKQFNKRVKGTEQFWSEPGVEAILALRALWVSQDQRWETYWLSRAAYSKAA